MTYTALNLTVISARIAGFRNSVTLAWARTVCIVIGASVLLGACSGGGDRVSAPPPPAITSVAVSPGTVDLQGVGATAAVSATIAPGGATGTISWRSDNTSIATVSETGSNATVTAVAAGTTRVIATAGGISGSTTVTVTPIVRSISTGSPTASVVVGGTTALTATLVSDPGAPTGLTWTSNAEAIATVSTGGVVSGVAPGTATITVASSAMPSIATSVAVTVTYPVVRRVTITPANVSILQNTTRQMSAVVDADGSTPTGVTWLSTVTTVAQVSTSGLVTAVAPGITTIRATSTANPGVSGTTTLTVVAPTVRAIVVSPATTTVLNGDVQQFSTTVDADDGANTAVTWSSTNTGVATVNASGLVTTVAPGTTTIRATSVLVPAIVGQATLTVTARPLLNAWIPRSLTPFPPESGGNNINQLWSVNSALAFAVVNALPNETRVMRWDGTIWNFPDIAPFDNITAVGGAGNATYIGNDDGQIAKYETFSSAASAFTAMTVPPVGRIKRIIGTSNETAVALANTSPAFFTGRAVLTYAWGTWTRLPDPTGITTTVNDIAATSTSNIVAVGAGGSRIQQYNGSAWMSLGDPGISGALTAVEYIGNDIVVLNGLFEGARWNGATWSTIAAPLPRPNAGSELSTNMVTCNGQLYAGSTFGGRVFRLNGTVWTVQATYGVATPGTYYTNVGCGADGVLRAGGTSSSIGRMNGSSWIYEAYAPWLFGAAIVREDVAYIAGGNGVVEKWDGTRWQIDLSVSSFGALTALSVSKDGGLVLTGGAGAPSGVWRKSNNSWTFDALSEAPRVLWAGNANFALSLGQTAAYKYNGSSWAGVNAPTSFSPADIDGSSPEFAISVGSTTGGGNPAQAVQWNGTTWSTMALPGGVGSLVSVDVLSNTLAFAVSSTTILKWNGTTWAIFTGPATTASDLPFRTIAANAANDVYLLSATGTLFHFDGTVWEKMATFSATPGTTPYYTRLAISPTLGILVGYGGAVFHGFSGANIRHTRR